MTVQEKLRKIAERADKATSGPWKYMGGDYVSFIGQQMFTVVGTQPDEEGHFKNICGSSRVELENAEFIASTRTDVPALLAVIAKLIEQRDGWLETDYKGDEIHRSDDDAELLAILEGK